MADSDDLHRLPRSERREALEAILSREFKACLLMAEEEEFPREENFFDLGLTSLRVMELKQRMETLLRCEISSNVLFNSPNLARLAEHLATDVLPGLFDEPVR
ncbi:acyl carrier protein [Streptomyces sp. NPDC053560]|uniref:acyl carrier protein n=1 Tax=Streptomyces sp. NPDC053560 TaxID=3365711 RepID=UPI0037D540CE